MSLDGYTSEQTAINDVVNTAQSNDDDDMTQWQSWIARANRIVNPFLEEQRSTKFAEQGSQKRAEAEPPISALGAHKTDSSDFVAHKEQ